MAAADRLFRHQGQFAAAMRSGKTSILFQYARHQALQGERVLLIGKRSNLEDAAATLTQLKGDEAMKGVGIRCDPCGARVPKSAPVLTSGISAALLLVLCRLLLLCCA